MTIISNQNLPWYAHGDPWMLNQNAWEPDRHFYYETIFTQSNGYLGIRAYSEEENAGVSTCRDTYLAGVFGHVNDAAMEQLRVTYPWPMLAMITLPELFACAITLNGETFTLADGTIDSFNRTLHLRNGLLTRHIQWTSPNGHCTRLLFERFLSADVPHLALQQITLTPMNWSGEASLCFRLDGGIPTMFRCGDRALPHLPMDMLLNQRLHTPAAGAATLTVTVKGTGHTVGMASRVSGDNVTAVCEKGSVLVQRVPLHLDEGVTTAVHRAVAVASSRDEIEADAVPAFVAETAEEAFASGFDASLDASQAVWDHRWATSDIVIDGPARDQAYIRYSAFSLLQMAPFHTDTISVPARAYAYNRYHGLYYWDSETFLMPLYLHTHPDVAEHLLRFRYRTLDGARRTARHLNAPGASFPWMTDSDEGNEQGPWGIGDYLWHQNADIAYAINQYVQATGDTRFMAKQGLEMIVESARFWMSRFETDANGVVHLHDTVGPDELDKHGKDNGYSSLMARRHLRLAVHWLQRIEAEYPAESKWLHDELDIRAAEPIEWTRAADHLAVPNVPGHNFPLQDEFLLAKEPLSFDGLTADEAYAMRHTHRVVKQADIIVALYLLQDEFTVEQMRDAYDFYEPMCLHYSSLSYNTHAIIASKIGRDDQAYEYFLKAAGLDLDNLRDATKDGLHAAALAGTWQTLVYGFVGMRVTDDALHLDPRLPEAWNAVSLHLIYRGYCLRLTCAREQCRIEVESAETGAPAHIHLNGETYTLTEGRVIETQTIANQKV